MRAKAVKLLAAGALTALLIQSQGPGASAAGNTAIQCYNEALGTVQETLANDCKGRIIGAEEAASIRKKRRDYIRKAFTKPVNNLVEGKRLAEVGSGFFIAADGSVVTNHHVVHDCATVSISPTFGEMVLATEVIPDENADLALLRADTVPPAVALLVSGADPALQGPAYVIGYPSRGLVAIEPILSPVEILRRESRSEHGPAVVVRGDVRLGNSGGPLLDSGGSVVGVVFAKINTVNIYQTTGQLVRDVGLAVPTDILETFLKGWNVDFHMSSRRPPQRAEQILNDARPFLVQIGCWK